MRIFIDTNGDPSTGILPHSITISGFPEPDGDDDRDATRINLQVEFSGLLDEQCSVRFEDECPDCEQRDGHSKNCPNQLTL